MNLETWLQSWLDLRKPRLKPRTIESYAALIRHHIAPALGACEVAALDPLEISASLAQISASGRSRTAEACFVLLRSALADLEPNPMRRVFRPAHVQQSPLAWDDTCITAYMAALVNHPRRLPLTLCITLGLRRGEVCGLRWEDIDFHAGVIHITNQRYRLDSGQIVDASPKSRASVRSIPIPGPLLPLLKAHRQLAGYLCPITPSSLDATHRRLVKRLGLPYTTLHGLRHTMATSCIRHGGEMRALQLLLGHASYATTANRYTHPDVKMLQTALDKAVQPCYTVIQ